MPRETHDGPDDRPLVERRDPRMESRPRDEDVRMDRRDRELYRDMPSVTSRSFGNIGVGSPAPTRSTRAPWSSR
jgi:hypothetical protein